MSALHQSASEFLLTPRTAPSTSLYSADPAANAENAVIINTNGQRESSAPPAGAAFEVTSVSELSQQTDMSAEVNRLLTFTSWPRKEPPVPTQFVCAGFYYSGHRDEVVCFSCNGRVSDWQAQGMLPDNVHRQRFPQCLLVQGRDNRNKPLEPTREIKERVTTYFTSNNTLPTQVFLSDNAGPIETSHGMTTPKLKILDRPIIDNPTSSLVAQSSSERMNPRRIDLHAAALSTDPATALSTDPAAALSTDPAAFSSLPPQATNRVDLHTTPLLTTPALCAPGAADSLTAQSSSSGQMSSHASTSDSDDMRYESARLDSLTRWPKPEVVSVSALAKAGLFYTGPQDRVQCAFCRGKLEGWVQGDNPEHEHRKHFGNRCRFIQGGDVGNVPAGEQGLNVSASCLSTSGGPSHVTGGPSHVTGGPSHVTEASSTLPILATPQNAATAASHYPTSTEQPTYTQSTIVPSHTVPATQSSCTMPQYSALPSRLATFQNRWPSKRSQSADDMARAGFVFLGQGGDMVKCFWCGGTLNNWTANDDPWVEHAHWFPHCTHIHQVKGSQFICNVQENYAQLTQAASPSPLRTTPTSESVSIAELTSGLHGTSVHDMYEQIQGMETVLALLEETGLAREDLAKAARVWATRNRSSTPNADQLGELAWSIKEGNTAQVSEEGFPSRRNSSTSQSNAVAQAHRPIIEAEDHSSASSLELEAGTSETCSGAADNTQGKTKSQKKKERRKAKKNAESQSMKDTETASTSQAEDDEARLTTEILGRQLHELQEQRICKVCLDEEINIVFLPCGHLVCCAMCAPALTKCPVCRANITDSVRTYLS